MDRERKVKDIVRTILGRYNNEFKGVVSGLCAIYKNEWWRTVEIEGLTKREYDTFWDFVEAPSPFGGDADRDIIEAICKRADNTDALELLFPEKYMSGKNRKKGPGRGHKTSSITTSFDRGSTYKLNRLKRERPEIAERVIAGEISANAGVIEAGFANKKMTVPLIKEKVVGWILKYFNEDDIEYIKNNL